MLLSGDGSLGRLGERRTSSSESRSCKVGLRPVEVRVEEVDAVTDAAVDVEAEAEAEVEAEAEAAGRILPNVVDWVFFAICSLRN